MANKPYIIALEEHYLDPEVKQLVAGFQARVPCAGSSSGSTMSANCGIREMDEAGIDLQVLSHHPGSPSC